MKNDIFLKKTSIKDIIDIWLWRNNKDTRLNSFNKNYINIIEHANWFFSSLRNNNRTILIGYDTKNNNKIGLVRLDKIKHKLVEVSININPQFRGQGYGKQLLKA